MEHALKRRNGDILEERKALDTSMDRCYCGKGLRAIDLCSIFECKRVYLCIGCNKEADKCSCDR